MKTVKYLHSRKDDPRHLNSQPVPEKPKSITTIFGRGRIFEFTDENIRNMKKVDKINREVAAERAKKN